MRKLKFDNFKYYVAICLISGFYLWPSSSLLAAPCCGGNGSSISLITGDEKAVFRFHFSHSAVVMDASADGKYYPRYSDDIDLRNTSVIEGGRVFQDRWQVRFLLPLIYQYRQVIGSKEVDMGLGDLVLGGGWEFMPLYRYSKWKPKGFVFANLTVPLGKSVYDSNNALFSDALSQGFYRLSTGFLFAKDWNFFDASFSSELHYALSRRFKNGEQSVLVKPGFGFSSNLGGGVKLWDSGVRLGIELTPIYENEVQVNTSVSEYQLVWNTSLSVQYSLTYDWGVSLVYTDQTLMGPAHNRALTRLVGLTLSKTWDR